MPTAEATVERSPVRAAAQPRRVLELAILVPALIVVALMLVWAEHDGGYDTDTWYWGALVVLTLLAATLIQLGARRRKLSRRAIIALAAFGGYTAWSYLSIAWAQVPGWALEGSNKALLYLLIFALFLVIPWTPKTAMWTLLVFVLGVGVLALWMLLRLAGGDHVENLLIGGRLAAPTGYFNSTVALFMMDALAAVALSVRRELPGLLRGALVAVAAASLQLCVMGQSRGWLFTLPLVVLVAIAVVRSRLRIAVAATLPIIAAVAPVHLLLNVFVSGSGPVLTHAAEHAGQTALLIVGGVFVLSTLLAWGDQLRRQELSQATQRRIGIAVSVAALTVACAGGIAATHGHPVSFVKRQWNGFSKEAPQNEGGGSHFSQVGSGRYDFWRVSLDAFVSHPIGGLGQDNFADYYVSRRRTYEEPRWTHSLEMRLLAQTGIVGFGLFAAFLIAAFSVALRAVRRGRGLHAAVAAAALMPAIVWVIHGSVDWFWEVPALSGPALGFLGMAVALAEYKGLSDRTGGVTLHAREPDRDRSAPAPPDGSSSTDGPDGSARTRRPRPRALPAPALWALGIAGFVAAVVVLTFPYLSVREVSIASDIQQRNPAAALRDLKTAADLNPLSPDPGRLAGTIALQNGQYDVARSRFSHTISVEPDGWYAWLGEGLANSALGNEAQAAHDYRVSASINTRLPVLTEALGLVDSDHPMTPAQALKLVAQQD